MKMIRSEFNQKSIYDLVVIGGGITGAAVAYDAASRGLSVALVERDDFGGKTSSATSKLIHGGLRYLANFELSLVRESLRERRILENIAPNFVYPAPNMVIFNNPETGKLKNRLMLKIGMILYDLLSFDKKFTRDRSKRLPSHASFSAARVVEQEPMIDSPELKGALVYYDCASISPERLTLAFIKSAAAKGADVANYMEATGFLIEGNRVEGIKIRDRLKGRNRTLRGRITVNCAGPWADRVLSLTGADAHGEVLRRSEGIHIITKKLTDKYIITSATPGGRHIFIIPWRNHSLIGTTDTEFVGSADEWQIKRESILGLIADVNSSFGDKIKLKYEDVLFCYGGLRPLVEDQTESVYESSRKYEIFDNKEDGLDGLITVEGGKYTTSRGLAENVMKLVCEKLGVCHSNAGTENEFLYGSEIEEIESFVDFCKAEYSRFPAERVDYLSRLYGTETGALMELASSDRRLAKGAGENGDIYAQVKYAVENEMAFSLSDIVFRRSGIGTLGDPGRGVIKQAAEIAAETLGWDAKRKAEEIKKTMEAFRLP